MTTGTSLGAMQWLYYMQTTDLCVDARGNTVQIQHKYHRGETKIGQYEIDGYFEKDGEKYFLEYNGCNFHPGCCKDNKIEDVERKKAYWEKKKQYLESLGKLIVKRECDWNNEKKTLNNIATAMPRILETDNQATLLEAIKKGQVFGFAVLDIETPEEVRESFGDFLFPPIIQKMEVTKDMMSPYMKERVIEENKERTFETLVQTYNGKQA